MSENYFDDGLYVKSENYAQHCYKTQERSKPEAIDINSSTFARAVPETTTESVKLNQTVYALEIEQMAIDCTFTDFGSRRQKLY